MGKATDPLWVKLVGYPLLGLHVVVLTLVWCVAYLLTRRAA